MATKTETKILTVQKVEKRNGDIVDFNPEKVVNAVFKAITATRKGNGEKTKKISNKVIDILGRRFRNG